MSETNYCAKHPDTETNLRCGRCEKLVCPRCMVHSPVGVRCPECAQVRKLPTFEVSGPYMARAIAAGLVLGVAGGVAYTIILWLIPFLSVFALLGAGYLIAEGISVAVNRKRGRPLKYVAAGSVLVTIIIASVPGLTLFGLLGGGHRRLRCGQPLLTGAHARMPAVRTLFAHGERAFVRARIRNQTTRRY